MKTINPETGNPWKYGETREDGKIFLCYRRHANLSEDGCYQINWLTPEAWERRKVGCAKAAQRAQKRNAKIIKEEKLKRGCAMCGYKEHHVALDFDHLDPSVKVRDIAKMHTTNIKDLMKEIKKCQVLCANCHRIKTYNQKTKTC